MFFALLVSIAGVFVFLVGALVFGLTSVSDITPVLAGLLAAAIVILAVQKLLQMLAQAVTEKIKDIYS